MSLINRLLFQLLCGTLFLLPLALITGCQSNDTDSTVAAERTTMSPAMSKPQPADTGPAPLAMYPRNEAPVGARVFIVKPQDGAVVTSPVSFDFGASGINILPAGEQKPNSGHHHLVINAELPDQRFPIPLTANYLHFDGGQTHTTLELPPGEHRIKLLLGDHIHIPHLPPVYSETINIIVVAE